MKFVCPEVDGSNTPFDASREVIRWVLEQRTNETATDFINQSGTWEQVAGRRNNQAGYIQPFYALTEAVKMQQRISLTSAAMTIDELASALGISIDVSYTESASLYWRVQGVYDLFRLPYWFTIYTESGLMLVKPVRTSESDNLGGITADDIIDSGQLTKTPGYEGEDGFDYTIAADTSIVYPASITDTWKDLALNKHKAKRDFILFHLGKDVNPLDWVSGPNQGTYVILSKKQDMESGEYIYLAVREYDEEGAYEADDVTPVALMLSDTEIDADTVDGYHASSFGLISGEITQFSTIYKITTTMPNRLSSLSINLPSGFTSDNTIVLAAKVKSVSGTIGWYDIPSLTSGSAADIRILTIDSTFDYIKIENNWPNTAYNGGSLIILLAKIS